MCFQESFVSFLDAGDVVYAGQKKKTLTHSTLGLFYSFFYYVFLATFTPFSQQEYCMIFVVLFRELLVDFNCCCHFAVNSGSCGALLQHCSIVRYVALPFY